MTLSMEAYTDRDDFYRAVADQYLLALPTRKPTLRIAQVAGVPHSTAARWVRVARKRGHLEPFTFG